MKRIWVFSPYLETARDACDEAEAAQIIVEFLDESDDISQDDIWVIRGERLPLKITKQRASSITIDGVKVR